VTGSLALQLIASIGSCWALWLMGNKHDRAPLCGLLAQAPWWLLVWHDALYGLIPITLAFTVIHARNIRRWRMP
jgi:hypothetical protein